MAGLQRPARATSLVLLLSACAVLSFSKGIHLEHSNPARQRVANASNSTQSTQVQVHHETGGAKCAVNLSSDAAVLANFGEEISRLTQKKVVFATESQLESFVLSVLNSDANQGRFDRQRRAAPSRPPRSRQSAKLLFAGNKTLERSAQTKRIIELLLTVDSAMIGTADGAQEEMETYVRTIARIVNDIYGDPSLGTMFEVRLAEIRRFVIRDWDNRTSNHRIDNFCSSMNQGRGQLVFNSASRSFPASFDAAVLITKRNICDKVNPNCSTLGFTNINRMCSNRSCSIVKDTGLVSTASTIAHEIGHLLGMVHDDENKALCNLLLRHNYRSAPPPHGGDRSLVMASNQHTQDGFWSWSLCSRETLSFYLRLPGKECLLEQRSTYRALTQNSIAHEATFATDRLPGEIYDGDEQCRLRTSQYWKRCDEVSCMMSCMDELGRCIRSNIPLADGTSCGANKWCIRGTCTYTYRGTFHEPQHGGWTGWSQWSPCSISCGLGISRRIRHCAAPSPRWGGNYCPGADAEYRTCLVAHCPLALTRKEYLNNSTRHQCHEAGIPTNQISRLQCALPCERMRPRDGTPCDVEKSLSSICVEGKCHPVGCENELDSHGQLDSCGVCNGNNSLCYRKVYRSLPALVKPGANTVVYDLDVKMSNVTVTYEKPTDKHYPGIYWHQHSSLQLFAKEYNVTIRRELYISDTYELTLLFAGMTIRYFAQLLDDRNTHESITVDRVTTRLEVQLHYAGGESLQLDHRVRVDYNAPIYDWQETDTFSGCSSNCSGTQQMYYGCFKYVDRYAQAFIVSDWYCEQSQNTPPRRLLKRVVRQCNTHCKFQWLPVPSEPTCPVRCGSAIVPATVRCVIMDTSNNSNWQVASNDSLCGRAPLTFNGTAECKGSCSPTAYLYGPWSNCSNSCLSVRNRSVVCSDFHGTLWDLPECAHLGQPETLTSDGCDRRYCASWSISKWSTCRLCAEGNQTRSVTCLMNGEIVSDRLCDGPKPESERPCDSPSCYQWHDESKCLRPDCRRRRVMLTCKVREQSTDAKYCAALPRPKVRTNCSKREQQSCRASPASKTAMLRSSMCARNKTYCPTWVTTRWSSCSAACGEGVQRRNVRCAILNETVGDYLCKSLQPKPVKSRACIKEQCFRWRERNLLTCKPTCEKHVSSVCQQDETGIIDSAACDSFFIGSEGTIPCTDDEISECRNQESTITTTASASIFTNCTNFTSCSEWHVSQWSDCSVTCGYGFNSRLVSCVQNGKLVDESLCSAQIQKPASTMSCSVLSCYFWNATRNCLLPECSQLNFEVQCLRGDLVAVSPDNCATTAQPVAYPAVCTDNERQLCKDKITSTTLLKTTPTSRTTKRTTTTAITSTVPVILDWDVGHWSECSKSCGTGIRDRRVQCVNKWNMDRFDDALCETAIGSKPASAEECKQAIPCVASWFAGEWSSCASSCEKKRRTVKCIDDEENEVNTSYCIKSTTQSMPVSSAYCYENSPCFEWVSGDWQQCDIHCGGRTFRQRPVSCRRNDLVTFNTYCSHLNSPIEFQSCYSESGSPNAYDARCSKIVNGQYTYEWFVSPFSECINKRRPNARCGNAFSNITRTVSCLEGETNRTVSDGFCRRPKPETIQRCKLKPCFPE